MVSYRTLGYLKAYLFSSWTAERSSVSSWLSSKSALCTTVILIYEMCFVSCYQRVFSEDRSLKRLAVVHQNLLRPQWRSFFLEVYYVCIWSQFFSIFLFMLFRWCIRISRLSASKLFMWSFLRIGTLSSSLWDVFVLSLSTEITIFGIHNIPDHNWAIMKAACT